MSYKRLFAITYHPMYLLVERDRGEPRVLERFPPWGAEDGREYLKRLERNLDFLESHDQARLNYELSATELLMIEAERPDLVGRMASLVKSERVELVGGDWSQAHAHVLGPESGFRQLRRGLDETVRVLGANVKVFFHQESAVHSQMPQLLRGLGFEWAITPGFPWYIEVLEGRFEFGQWPHDGGTRDYYVPEDSAMVQWAGLDGTEVPLYLHGALRVVEDDIINDDQQGLLHLARLWIKCPDIEEVTDDELGWMEKYGELSCLGPALEVVSTAARPPAERARVRLGTHWSYIEGMWCEELVEALTAAETDLVALSGTCSAATWLGRGDVALTSLDELERHWDEILTWQHHDIMWTETTDLKRQAITAAKEVSARAGQRVREITEALVPATVHGEERQGTAEYVINPYPYAVDVRLPDQYRAAGGVEGGGARSLRTLSRFGLNTVDVPGSPAAVSDAAGSEGPQVVDGCLQWPSSDGALQLLAPGSGALVYRREDGSNASSVGTLREVERTKAVECERYRFSGSLDDISVSVSYTVWPAERIVESEYTLGFEKKELGVMWDDLSKLRVRWLMPDTSHMFHDIPFGVEYARPDRVVHATSWIAGDVASQETIQVIHFGNPKFLVTKDSVSSVLAWGGREFTNRMHRGFLKSSQFDLRLDGMFTRRFIVAAGRPEAWGLARRAQGLRLNPQTVVGAQQRQTSLKGESATLTEPLVCTAVEPVESKIRMRVFNCSDLVVPAARVWSSGEAEATGLDGSRLEAFGPWQIGYVTVSP